jgi:DNA-binding transcriptional MerR regulator
MDKNRKEGGKVMYTRGQLAQIAKVGRKAIRLYEAEGMITSSKIDPWNSYHYYDENQIARLEKIKHYKQLGFSLADIKGVLCKGIPENEILSVKKTELDRNIKDMQELRRSMDQIVKIEYQDARQVISESYFPECICLFIEENMDLEMLGTSAGKLYEKASKYNLEIAGAHFVKYEGLLTDDSAFKMITCLPILQTDASNDAADYIRVEKAAKCIHLNFTGGFSKAGNAHIWLKEYMDKKKTSCTGTMYEVYNRDMSMDIYYELSCNC